MSIHRVILRNYKSIGHCDVSLGSLTYLIGGNGAGKSHFLDALHLVRDALVGSLDNALNERGGLSEVLRRSSGHPTHFGIRLDLSLPSGQPGRYAFNVRALHDVERRQVGPMETLEFKQDMSDASQYLTKK